jgi:BirA family biotin operon repressor/biotin-[acetyl-CoA-carboxylase] ligase
VADAAERLSGPGAGIGLKWPNDLTWRGRKLCGILSVAGSDAGGGAYAVVGIGANVNAAPRGIEGPPVSLGEISGTEIDCVRFAADVITAFWARYRRLTREGFAAQIKEWEARSGWIGREVEVETGDRRFSGTAAGLGPCGALRLRLGDGTVVEVFAADATLNKHARGTKGEVEK